LAEEKLQILRNLDLTKGKYRHVFSQRFQTLNDGEKISSCIVMVIVMPFFGENQPLRLTMTIMTISKPFLLKWGRKREREREKRKRKGGERFF